METVLSPAGTTRALKELVGAARKTINFRENPVKELSIAHDTVYVMTGPPKSAETGVTCRLSMSMGAMMKMPSILFVQNKEVELSRFNRSIRAYKKSYDKCADAVGCREPHRLTATTDVTHFVDIAGELAGRGSEILILLDPQNNDRVKNVKRAVVDLRKMQRRDRKKHQQGHEREKKTGHDIDQEDW